MKIIQCDGSGWNGREAKYCIAFEGRKPIIYVSKQKLTSNEAEYMAVITALANRKSKDAEIRTDSRLVVEQVNGGWKVKEPRLKPLCQQVRDLLDVRGAVLVWIPREENRAGKELER